jgi:DNA-directed RNA polymerase subunit M/transcription elongation factor TFIIS
MEYKENKDSIFSSYDTIPKLIKEYSLPITTIRFNKALKKINFIIKEPLLNQNNWIIKGDGLKYGINLIKDSKYRNQNIPDWYKVHIFDNNTMKFINLDSDSNIKMTSALFEKNKFYELYQLVKEQLEDKKINKIIKDETKKTEELEREDWLRHVNCPTCGEETNIHKKDKRKRAAGYSIQRFFCNKCNKVFQMNFDELKKLIQEYQERNSIL